MSYIPEPVDRGEIKAVNVLTPRLQKLKKEWEEAEPQVYVDERCSSPQSWKETEGLPLDIRWAKALEKRLDECPIILRDGELLAGSLTKFVRRKRHPLRHEAARDTQDGRIRQVRPQDQRHSLD
jgi:formate C-acetyltransferase